MARSAPPTRLCAAAGTGRVAITDTRHLDLADLRAALRAKPVHLPETELTAIDALLRPSAPISCPTCSTRSRLGWL